MARGRRPGDAVTLKDVARASGLSVTTISRVLDPKSRPLFAPRTCARVDAAVARLGYQRNAAACALRRGRTNRIGLFSPGGDFLFSSEYFHALMHGVVEEVNRRQYLLMLTLTPDPKHDRAFCDRVAAIVNGGEVDGVLLLTYSEKLRPEFRKATPTVVCGNMPFRGVSNVDCDNVGGARAAVEHLIGLGHRRILHLGYPHDGSGRPREEGYRQALVSAGLPLDRKLLVEAGFRREDGQRAMAQALEKRLDFTAVFAVNDDAALGAIEAIREKGLRVPEDLSVVGFDDIPSAAREGLTTVRQPVSEIGRAAVETLVALVEGQETGPVRRALATKLIVRQSAARRR